MTGPDMPPYGIAPQTSDGPTDWQDRSTWTPGNPPTVPPNDESDRLDERVRKTWRSGPGDVTWQRTGRAIDNARGSESTASCSP